jgi:hypothetical protein
MELVTLNNGIRMPIMGYGVYIVPTVNQVETHSFHQLNIPIIDRYIYPT